MVNVLFVEDEESVARGRARYLKRYGHECTIAPDGRAGRELLTQGPGNADIIFCDFNMPNMDGYEFTRTVRTDPQYVAYRNVPIVGVGDFPDAKKEYLTYGDCMPKPFTPDALIASIQIYCLQ